MNNAFGQSGTFIRITRIWQDGFEHTSSYSQNYTLFGNVTQIAGRVIGNAVQLSSNGGSMARVINPTVSAITVGIGVYIGGGTGTNALIDLSEGAISHLNLVINTTSNVLQLQRGGSGLVNGTLVLQRGAWYYIEIGARIHDTTGYGEVRVNGITDITFNGDTRNAATGVINLVEFKADDTRITSYDDLYINDSIKFDGDQVMETLFPTGVGNYSQWTSSTANPNWQNLDEVPPSESDYNSASSADLIDTFAFGNLSSTPTQIHAVSLLIFGRKTSSATVTLAPIIRPTTTDYVKDTYNPGTTATYNTQIIGVNPDTNGEWTNSEISALEAGYKRVV